MRYIIAGILSLALLGWSIDARKDAGEYWQGVVKDQRMQEGHVKGNDCHTSEYEESLARDFEQRSTTMAHANHGKFIDDTTNFAREFEPRPSVTAYVGNVKPKLKKRFVTDFEPRPSATSYVNKRDFEEAKAADVKDFEPRPNISAYTDDKVKSVDDEFEPRPNISAYADNIMKSVDEKSYTKDFEPIPNVSAYTDNVKSNYERGDEKDFEPRPNISSYNEDATN